ncbi:TOMM precursor leader peptide-binding protein [Mesorhizobium sp. M0622]|uniref:TOMM precursor leader peptide-binding protein n=1 Tax=unclassified Mesorhizobium TaxID=325217 RepID=UPI0033396ECB
MDKLSSIPSFPRLQYGVEIVPVEEGKVLLRSFTGSVMLSGDFVAVVLPLLLPLLDGKHGIEDLAAEFDETLRPEIEDFLTLIQHKGFLGKAARDGREDDAVMLSGEDRAYWSLYGASASEAARRLAQSTVVIAGLGDVGKIVATMLAASGVGTLVLVEGATPSQSSGREEAEASETRKTELSLRKQYASRVVTIPTTIDDAAGWEETVAAASVVAVISDTMSMGGYDRANEVCIKHGVPWVSARIDRQRAIIGPFVIPNQTACFACFEARSRANADHPEDHEALYRHWKKLNGRRDMWPSLLPFAGIVGNFVALDLLRVLAGEHLSAAAGRIINIDLLTLERSVHEVLKLPRCPACSRLRDRRPTKIWDIIPTETRSVG